MFVAMVRECVGAYSVLWYRLTLVPFKASSALLSFLSYSWPWS